MAELTTLSEDPDLWNDPDAAQKIMQERTRLSDRIDTINRIANDTQDHIDMIAMAEEEGDQGVIKDSQKEINTIRREIDKLQLESLLNGEVDENDAFISINAGAGGTESQDWANMLLRMYTRWAEARGFKVDLLEMSNGEEAGIKSATIRVSGHQAYGWIKTETGVHRLVRISPFDSNAKRHTSFASIGVTPVIDDSIEIEINEADLRIDTYRSSGAGGQHVNTTDSAVRITHIPTGVVAACQNERSQHSNRAQAMDMLKARLYEKEVREREELAAKERGEKTDIGWGHQIRSYVLHPYQMIKDLRTNHETSNTAAVLDGDLDDFLNASLAAQAEN